MDLVWIEHVTLAAFTGTTILLSWYPLINSLAPGKFEWKFRYVIFKRIWVIDGWGFSCEIAPVWMSLDFTDDQSTLVQVMAWCHQATSHYLSQCWPRSLSPYGVTRPRWGLVVAVAAYSQLASRSQAKLHTKKLSPLVHPCAAAPAQSTRPAHRSLWFSPR